MTETAGSDLLSAPESDAAAAGVGVVVYALDVSRVAAFYAAVLGVEPTETAPRYIVLEGPGIELVVVAVADRIAADITVTDPPERREDTAVKRLLPVDSIERVRSGAPSLGGVVDPVAREWRFRGWRVCDGHDPEGNVLQVRER